MKASISCLRLVISTASALLVAAANDSRADTVVTSLTDADLRGAVAAGGLVTFNVDGIITLTNEIVISNNVTLDAVGHSIVLSGGGQNRHFVVGSNVQAELRNMAIANGYTQGSPGVPNQNGGPGQGGSIYNSGTLRVVNCSFLNNVSLGGGAWPGAQGFAGAGLGGALYCNSGTFIATNCTFSSNSAFGANGVTNVNYTSNGGSALGGALYSISAVLQLSDCVFTNNRAVAGVGQSFGVIGQAIGGGASGGALAVLSGSASLLRCNISGNTMEAGKTSTAQGGGISLNQANAEIVECTLQGNVSQGGNALSGGVSAGGNANGGGAYLFGGKCVFNQTTVAGNTARGGLPVPFSAIPSPGSAAGGGVCWSGSMGVTGTFVATNCTFHGNLALAGGVGVFGGIAQGGGIYNAFGTMTLASVTIANNSALVATNGTPGSGGGIYSYPSSGSVTLLSSILANNPSGSNGFGSVTDAGYNLSSDASLNFSAVGSMTNTNPVLGPLDLYGGPTLTMPLLGGSPALDAGDTANTPATDQRGRARPYGAASDIGAFESSAPFVMRGRLYGTIFSPALIFVSAGPSNTLSTAGRDYSFDALPAGTYVVSASTNQFVVPLISQSVTVGPDQLGVDLPVLELNALAIAEMTNGNLHLIYAGTNATAFRVQMSTNLQAWDDISTNTVGPGKLSDFYVPATEPWRFYRAVQP